MLGWSLRKRRRLTDLQRLSARGLSITVGAESVCSLSSGLSVQRKPEHQLPELPCWCGRVCALDLTCRLQASTHRKQATHSASPHPLATLPLLQTTARLL